MIRLTLPMRAGIHKLRVQMERERDGEPVEMGEALRLLLREALRARGIYTESVIAQK